MEEEKKVYKEGDKCNHCGGNISPNCCGDKIKYWCDDCGSNNPSSLPNISIEIKQ